MIEASSDHYISRMASLSRRLSSSPSSSFPRFNKMQLPTLLLTLLSATAVMALPSAETSNADLAARGDSGCFPLYAHFYPAWQLLRLVLTCLVIVLTPIAASPPLTAAVPMVSLNCLNDWDFLLIKTKDGTTSSTRTRVAATLPGASWPLISAACLAGTVKSSTIERPGLLT